MLEAQSMNAAAGAAAAGAAAAAQQQINQMEEHEMTNYPVDVDNWEFKIIRSSFGNFANQERREEILAKEAEAKWELVEVFDHARIRLRRPISAKQLDGKLDFDPYRTLVDNNISINYKSVAVILVVAFMIGGAFIVALMVESM
jgi:hypothetical protein